MISEQKIKEKRDINILLATTHEGSLNEFLKDEFNQEIYNDFFKIICHRLLKLYGDTLFNTSLIRDISIKEDKITLYIHNNFTGRNSKVILSSNVLYSDDFTMKINHLD